MDNLIIICILVYIAFRLGDIHEEQQITNKHLESIRITQTTIYKDSVSSYRDLHYNPK